MKFKVNQCLVSVYGTFNKGIIYDSDNYPEEFINSMIKSGYIEDTTYISSSIAKNISFNDLLDVSIDIHDEQNAGNMLVIDENCEEICSIPKDYNVLENRPILEITGTQEEPVIISELSQGIYRFTGFGKISEKSPTNDIYEVGLLIVTEAEDSSKDVVCVYNEQVDIWKIDKESNYTIKTLTDKDYVDTNINEVIKDAVMYKNSESDKRHIILENDSNICGKAVDGISHNLLQINRWNVADVGATGVQLTLNTTKDIFVQTPKTEQNSFGLDFIPLATTLYKIVLNVPSESKYYQYNGQALYNGVLGNYVTATVTLDNNDNIVSINIETTGQIQ